MIRAGMISEYRLLKLRGSNGRKNNGFRKGTRFYITTMTIIIASLGIIIALYKGENNET